MASKKLQWPEGLDEHSVIHALEAGSFSDEAARRVAQSIGTERIQHAKSINGVWQGIDGGDLGIVPFEGGNLTL